jgi:hypothetical protein
VLANAQIQRHRKCGAMIEIQQLDTRPLCGVRCVIVRNYRHATNPDCDELADYQKLRRSRQINKPIANVFALLRHDFLAREGALLCASNCFDSKLANL